MHTVDGHAAVTQPVGRDKEGLQHCKGILTATKTEKAILRGNGVWKGVWNALGTASRAHTGQRPTTTEEAVIQRSHIWPPAVGHPSLHTAL